MISSYLNKLKAMTVREIAFRLKEKFFVVIEEICYRASFDLTGREVIQTVSKLSLFFLDSYRKAGRLAQIEKHSDYKLWIQEADDILKGKINLLGKEVTLFQDSHIDPIQGIPWPKVFYNKVAKNKAIADCDIKYIWEVNRHQYLIILGKAYWITGDDKYAQKVFSTIQSWIQENPYNTGVNWTSSLELAVRAISWIWAVHFCKKSVNLTPEFQVELSRSLFEHGNYIDRHLSHFSSPYNHLIGEAAGLHMIGSFLSQIEKGRYWENKGWQILEDQIEKQFHSDGMSVEQASFYHHFTLGFYLQAILLRKLKGQKVIGKVLNRVEKAVEFSVYLTKPDNSMPMIGDIDNARSIYFNSGHSWDFSGLKAIGAVLFNRPDFKKSDKKMPEEIFWLLNDEEYNAFLNIKPENPGKTSIMFKESGYSVLRDSWDPDSHYLCFDCGEIAAGLSPKPIPSAAHGHADALSFELSAFGRPFVVEGGSYTYFGDMDWHRHFRHEEAHNALLMNDYRQARFAGRFKWQNVVMPRLWDWITHSDYDYVSGIIEYGNHALYKREILYIKKRFWVMVDSLSLLDLSPLNSIESFLHFHPSVEISIEKDAQQIQAENNGVSLIINHSPCEDVVSHKGDTLPSQGWMASGYGIRQAAWSVGLKWNTAEKKSILPMIIIPVEKGKTKVHAGEFIKKDNSYSNRLKIDHHDYSIHIGKTLENWPGSKEITFCRGCIRVIKHS